MYLILMRIRRHGILQFYTALQQLAGAALLFTTTNYGFFALQFDVLFPAVVVLLTGGSQRTSVVVTLLVIGEVLFFWYILPIPTVTAMLAKEQDFIWESYISHVMIVMLLTSVSAFSEWSRRRAFTTLATTVDAIQRTQKRIQKKRDALGDFAMSVAFDFRTPLRYPSKSNSLNKNVMV